MLERFAAGDKKAIHPNIRGSVFAIVLQNGGEKEVRVLGSHQWTRYLNKVGMTV